MNKSKDVWSAVSDMTVETWCGSSLPICALSCVKYLWCGEVWREKGSGLLRIYCISEW